LAKNKKHMRRVRHLKRNKKNRDRKSSPNHKDRSYYIGKERRAIIELRTHHKSYWLDGPWIDTIMNGYHRGIE